MSSLVRHWGLVGLLALLVIAGLPGPTGAAYPAPVIPAAPAHAPIAPAAPAAPLSHDRSGQLTWEAVGLNTAQIQVAVGLRRSYYMPFPTVGDTIVYVPI